MKRFMIVLVIMLAACNSGSEKHETVNRSPEEVILYHPARNAEIKSSKVLLVWSRSFDSKGEPVKYNLYFQKDNADPSLYASDLTDSTFEIDSLEPGSYYFWKVVAVDKKGNRSESEISYFKTASVFNSPPTRPMLISPKPAAVLYKLPVEFKWKASVDPDGDPVKYTILVGSSPADLHPLSKNLFEPSYLAVLNRGNGYYWKVVASDGKGGESESGIYYFKVSLFSKPLKPLYPLTMTSPYLGAYTNNLSFIDIYWNNITSPNGGRVEYFLTIGGKPDLSDSTRYGPLYENHVDGVPLARDTTYFLKITAVDQYGARSESPLQWFFNKDPSESFDGRFKYIFMGGTSASFIQFRSLGCGISFGGDVWCWGDNSALKLLTGIQDYSIWDNGDIGYSIRLCFFPPRRILLPPWIKFKKVGINIGSVEEYNPTLAMGAALSDEGELWFWNDHGTPIVISPYRVKDPAGGKWKDFAVRSRNHICAIDTEGYLYCWGENSHKQVGSPNSDWVDLPFQVTTPTSIHWKEVTVGYLFSCAISEDQPNYIYCWGNNDWGQLGIEQGGDFSTPIPIRGNTSWKKIAAGMDNVCALDADDNLWCWGRNSWGESGVGASYGERVTMPVRVTADGVRKWKDFFMGFRSVCALDQDNSLWCWGNNAPGGNNIGYALLMTTGTAYYKPIKVMENFELGNLSIGATTACGLKDGTLWCWGDRGNFYFGDDYFYSLRLFYTPFDSNYSYISANLRYPQLVQHPYGREWKYFNISNWETCGIDDSDQMWCWGVNNNGSLGIGNNESIDYPAKVKGDIKWKSVTFSESYSNVSDKIDFYNWSCGISVDNKLYCWGVNDHGQLGVGDTTDRNEPIEVKNSLLTSWKMVAAGNDHACAIDQKGTLWCWGNNDKGEVGQNSKTDYLTPVSFESGLRKWVDVTAGYKFTCAIDEGGETYCWGNNDHYVLGITTSDSSYLPVKINTPESFIKVSAGLDHVCGLTASGNIYCWGSNSNGELGRGETSGDSPDVLPVTADGDPFFVSLHCIAHSCSAIDSDGFAWHWGRYFLERKFRFIAFTARFGNFTQPTVDTVVPEDNEGYIGSEFHKCYLGNDRNLYCWGHVYLSSGWWGSLRLYPLGVGVRYRFRPVKVDFYFR